MIIGIKNRIRNLSILFSYSQEADKGRETHITVKFVHLFWSRAAYLLRSNSANASLMSVKVDACLKSIKS